MLPPWSSLLSKTSHILYFLIRADSETSRANSGSFYCQFVSQASPRIARFYHLTDELSKIIPNSNIRHFCFQIVNKEKDIPIDSYNYCCECESILLSSMCHRSGTRWTSLPDYMKIACIVSHSVSRFCIIYYFILSICIEATHIWHLYCHN